MGDGCEFAERQIIIEMLLDVHEHPKHALAVILLRGGWPVGIGH